jgi:hypothetical protein
MAASAAIALLIVVALPGGAERKFYDDDPIARELDTEDASGAQPWDIDLIWDLSFNTFATPGRTANPPRAGNINTIGEVPDSNWFTNRIGARPLTVAEIVRGPQAGEGPVGRLTVIRPKPAGASPGFVVDDERGEAWFLSFDAAGHPDAATGAILVANKLFWALGYWQVESFLTRVDPAAISIADTARLTPPSGRRRPMRRSDTEAVLARSHRSPDGSYRAVAGKAIPRTIGGFRYHDTRPDDPNDIVPHEDRRELRALRVFGAWTNLVDMKAGNTLDALVEENGRQVVRHYLQDVGSTFGVGALGPHGYEEGFEFLYEGTTLLKRLVSFGFHRSAWQTARYEDVPSIGRFEAEAFDPRTWRPRTPNGAFLRARDDDMFWAARRVAAFSDELIEAAARTGEYSDPAAAPFLARILMARRDKIAQAYLPAINPLADFALDASGRLTFVNVAEQAGVASAPGGYRAAWFAFDNATGDTRPLGAEIEAGGPSMAVPAQLPSATGAYVKAQVWATDPPEASWETPVDVYFRRLADGWRLVGLERGH